MSFQTFELTNSGINLLAQVQAELGSLNFTRIKIGSGEYFGNIKDLTDIITEFHEFPITSTQVQPDDSVKIQAPFNNETFTQGYVWREIGVYAQLGDSGQEILYSYSKDDTPETIPNYDGGNNIYRRTLDLRNYISDVDDVTLEVVELTNKYDFNNVAEMQAASYIVDGDRIKLWGYYALGDGGAHERIFSLVDNGTGIPFNGGFAIVTSEQVRGRWFGLRYDGSDETEIFENIIATHDIVNFEGEKILLTERINFRSDTTITFEKRIIITSDYVGSESSFESQKLGILNVAGELGTETTLLTSDAEEGSFILNVTDASIFNVGDMIIADMDEFTPVTEEEILNVYGCKIAKITEINVNEIKINNSLAHKLLISKNAKITKINEIKNCHIKGDLVVEHIDNGDITLINTIKFIYSENCSIDKLKTFGGYGRNVSLEESANINIGSIKLNSPYSVSDGKGYGFSAIRSNDITIKYIETFNSRHTFDTSSGSHDIIVNTLKGVSDNFIGNVSNGHGMNTKRINITNSISDGTEGNVGLGNFSFYGDQDWNIVNVDCYNTILGINFTNGSSELIVNNYNCFLNGLNVQAINIIASKNININNMLMSGDSVTGNLINFDNLSSVFTVKYIKAVGLASSGSIFRMARESEKLTVLYADLDEFEGNLPFDLSSNEGIPYDLNFKLLGGTIKGDDANYVVINSGGGTLDGLSNNGITIKNTEIEGRMRLYCTKDLIIQNNKITGNLSTSVDVISVPTENIIITNNYGNFTEPDPSSNPNDGVNVYVNDNIIGFV